MTNTTAVLEPRGETARDVGALAARKYWTLRRVGQAARFYQGYTLTHMHIYMHTVFHLCII